MLMFPIWVVSQPVAFSQDQLVAFWKLLMFEYLETLLNRMLQRVMLERCRRVTLLT